MVRRWRNTLHTVPRHARWLLLFWPCIGIPLLAFGGSALGVIAGNVYLYGHSAAGAVALMVLLVVVEGLIIFMIFRRLRRLRDRVRVAGGAICCTCGYDLSGFESERPINARAGEVELQRSCPECGDPFDLEEVKHRCAGASR